MNNLSLRASSVIAGQVAIGLSAAQLPSATARRFMLRALVEEGNFDAEIAIGGDSTVTLETGWVLKPSDIMPFVVQLSNLNILWAIASVIDQKLAYFGEQ